MVLTMAPQRSLNRNIKARAKGPRKRMTSLMVLTMAKRPSIKIIQKDVIRILVPRLNISIKTALWCHC